MVKYTKKSLAWSSALGVYATSTVDTTVQNKQHIFCRLCQLYCPDCVKK